MHILAIDDDPTMIKLLGFVLRDAGYDLVAASTWAGCMAALEQHRPGLILLEARVEGASGFDLCRRLRGISDLPIIFLAKQSQVEERVMGLAIGGDDYIAKPFEPSELLARIKAVLRRCGTGLDAPVSPLSYGCFVLDQLGQRVLFDAHSIDLTPTEFRLLEYLMLNGGHVLSPRQILYNVWERADSNDYSLVSTYILRLRNKIEPEPNNPRYIITVWNLGYKFEAGESRAALKELHVGR